MLPELLKAAMPGQPAVVAAVNAPVAAARAGNLSLSCQSSHHLSLRALPLRFALGPPLCLEGGPVLAAPQVESDGGRRGKDIPAGAPQALQLQQLLSEEEAGQVAGVRSLRGAARDNRLSA